MTACTLFERDHAGGHDSLAFLLCLFVSVAPGRASVSYTHLRAHETVLDLVCRLLLEKKTYKKKKQQQSNKHNHHSVL